MERVVSKSSERLVWRTQTDLISAGLAIKLEPHTEVITVHTDVIVVEIGSYSSPEHAGLLIAEQQRTTSAV
jgi:hypothetical protein